MNFSFKLFCIILILENAILEPEFIFRHLNLGDSGFLITWKPNTTQKENNQRVFFKFGHKIKTNKNDNFSFSKFWVESRGLHGPMVESSKNQYKVHSLIENTPYEVIIQQYSHMDDTIAKTYSLEMTTNRKRNTKPAKPDFEYYTWDNTNYKIEIRWFPCGKERYCNGQEAGTHFALKFRAIDRKGEYIIQEYIHDYYKDTFFLPGIQYEVKVASINGDYETDSDPQEIFVNPMFGAVTSVEVTSFPNASVSVSWKPPKYSSGELEEYGVTVVNDSTLINYPVTLFAPLQYAMGGFYRIIQRVSASFESKLFDKPVHQFKSGLTYTFFIIPYGKHGSEYGAGFETRVKYTLPANKTN